MRFSNGTRELVLTAAMTAVLEVSKHALDALPNIELISLLVILYTLHFGLKKTMAPVLIFSAVEMMIYGIGIWTVTYFYVWPVLVLLANAFRNHASRLNISLLSAVFGLFFGLLCALVTVLIGGIRTAFAWWIAGIPYDLVHCAGNFVIAFLLYLPLSNALSHLTDSMFPKS